MFVSDGGVCGVALLVSLLIARVRDGRVCASISGRNRSRRETLGTAAPVDHLGLIDLVIRVVGGGQARGDTDRAVDVDHPSAAAADQVVMVVSDPVLETGR